MTTIESAPIYGSSTYYPSTTKSGNDTANDRPHNSPKVSSYDIQNMVDSRQSVLLSFQGKLVAMTQHKIDLTSGAINIAALPEDKYKAYMQREKDRLDANKMYIESQHTEYNEPENSNDPRTHPYATITSGGRVIATIDNQGVVKLVNNDWGALSGRLLNEVNGTNGPELAHARATQIAHILGGKINITSTALSQSQFNELPPSSGPEKIIDHGAIKTVTSINNFNPGLHAMRKL